MKSNDQKVNNYVAFAAILIVILGIVALFNSKLIFRSNVVDYSPVPTTTTLISQNQLKSTDVIQTGSNVVVAPWKLSFVLPTNAQFNITTEPLFISDKQINLSAVQVRKSDASSELNVLDISIASVEEMFQTYGQAINRGGIKQVTYGKQKFDCATAQDTQEGTQEYTCYLKKPSTGYFMVKVSVKNTAENKNIVSKLLASFEILT